jgi:type II secretory ATPase GspE/PulE/Tfp pilus assembly ATPase PilB-like protein
MPYFVIVSIMLWTKLCEAFAGERAASEADAQAMIRSRLAASVNNQMEWAETIMRIGGLRWLEQVPPKHFSAADSWGAEELSEWRLIPVRSKKNAIEAVLCDHTGILNLEPAEQLIGESVRACLTWPEQWEELRAWWLASVRMEPLVLVEEEQPSIGKGWVRKVLNSVIECGSNHEISDAHFEALAGTMRIRLRRDGALSELISLPAQLGQSLIGTARMQAGLPLDQRHLPGDGSLCTSDGIRLRLATLPGIWGESMTLRWPNQMAAKASLGELGMDAVQQTDLEETANNNTGLFVIGGATGSGKTTTLYAIARALDPGLRVITLEDPVEFRQAEWTQTDLSAHAATRAADMLRAILRQAPDVLLLGELRDAESTSVALRAATTGHRVWCTLHTSGPSAAIARLLALGADRIELAHAIQLILTQTLVCTGLDTTPNRFKRRAEYKFWRPTDLWRTNLAGTLPLIDLWQEDRQHRNFVNLNSTLLRHVTKPV